ncbi:MAG: hypothetical protein C0459_11430 [Chitinophaga sp.]|jgi:hypothetical protein|nr:hypothetical protein [Chitinophaga sp.]
MFKQFVTILLLTAFSLQTFQKAGMVLNYYTNTASYAKNCENKARPMLHCNGKCQLMKKLKQEENKDKQNPERRSDNKDEVLSSKSFFASVSNTVITSNNSYLFRNNNLIKDIPSDFFHPPGV